MARTDSDDDPMEEAVPLEESVNNSDVSAEIQSIHSFPTNHVDAMDIDSFSEAGTPTPSGRGPTLLEIVLPTLESLGREADEYAIFEDVYSDDDSEEVVRVLDEKEVDGNVMLFRVEFAGGDIEDDVTFDRLSNSKNGLNALQIFANEQEQEVPRDASPEFVDSSGEESNAKSSNNGEIIASQFYGNSRKDREKKLLSLQAERKLKASRSATAEELSDDDSARVRAPSGRTTRSKGIKEVKMLSYKKGATEYSDDDGIVVSDIHPRATRKSTRNVRQTTRAASAAAQRRKPRRSADSSEYESDDGRTRRSGRTKRVKPSYAEPELDDDFAGIDVEVKKKPRVIHAKEIFPVLDEDDEFVMVHNKVCGVCKTLGHSRERGKLICCQGCSTSYHKDCLGIRAGREHLVTKISDENFVLQCKRCIGKARIKDPLQAYFDKCSTCHVQGLSCAPFKALTEKKKATTQDSREVTADTHVPNDLLYNAENVLFRCDGCYRAWHYEHLPQRGSKRGRTGSDDVHKERIEQYTKDFMCVECNSTPEKIGTVVAWRPVDEVSRQEVTSLDLGDFNEDEREYLVRFEGDSYFHVRWMPGPWIAGAHPLKKMGFLKHDPPAILTEEEAIKEEWVRVEIVLDVEYTSIVPSGAIVDVDLARIKEVRRALVKYKGLGYEDVFWDEPPKETDTERWADWRRAYDDYIHGLFIKPAKGTTKKVEKARRTPFANLEMQGQPSYIKGGTLMDYQKEGMNWLYYKWWEGQNAILADEMGLGKTIQIISFLAVLFEEQKIWPFLIVVPHSTVPNWKREIQTWSPNLRVVAYYGVEAARKITREYEMFHKNGDLKCHIVVTSYTTPISDSGVLRKVPWMGLIVDEGQRLKNDATQLYTELQKYKIHHKVLLTGTPLQNNPRELFNLLQFLEPKTINASQLEEEFGVLTNENVPRLHALIRPYFLRRTKAQVLTHLPPMAEVIVPVSMSALQKKLYKSILSKDVSLIKSIMSRGSTLKKTDRAKLNNLLMQLRKCVCHPFLYNSDIEEITTDDNKVIHSNLVEAGSKLGLLNIMLPKLQQRGHRVLMFSQFLGMLDIIEDFLNGLGLKFHRLDGDVSTMDRQKRIDEFNAPDSDYFAFLLSTRAGGVGINLATADTVILLDPDFNPHQDIQALSRAHRIGQKNKVLVFHLMTRDTAEERIMQIGKKKLLLDHLIIERMGVGVQGEEEDSIDVESVLSFGARRLFEDDDEDRIKYDDESVDKLLDRSLIEQTKTTNENGDKSAENAFSFARVWANDKTSLEENVGGDESDGGTPEPGFWDKILREREEEARREIEANREELGRGRRRKTAIYTKYAVDDEGKDNDSDTDFQAPAEHESESEFEHELNMPIVDDLMEVDHNGVKHRGVMAELPRRTTNGHPDAPTAQPGMIPYQELRRVELIAPTDNPAFSKCKACKHRHAPGTCTLKKAGVENCPLCGIAHLPKATICPHMSSETQLTSMLNALRESNEDRDIVDAAKRYVRRRKKQVQHEKRESEIRAEKEAAAFAP